MISIHNGWPHDAIQNGCQDIEKYRGNRGALLNVVTNTRGSERICTDCGILETLRAD